MSLGQTMISIAALVAITVMVVTSQNYLVEGQRQVINSEVLDYAAMSAEALITEITRKDYDLTASYTNYPSDPPGSAFTAAGSVGPNSTEFYTVFPCGNAQNCPDEAPFKSNTGFNDADDYDGYRRTVTPDSSSGLPPLTLSVEVYYVSEFNPNGSKSYSTTFLKRVIVTVTPPSYLDLSPISFQTTVAY